MDFPRLLRYLTPMDPPIHGSTGKSAPPYLRALREGVDPAVLDWLRWLEHGRGRAPATANRYLAHVAGLEGWLATRGVSLLQATPALLEEYTGLVAHQRGLSPRARRPLVAATRGFFKWATQRGLVASDPAAQLPYPRFGRPLPSPLGLDHAQRLIMAPGVETFLGLRDTAILAVLMGTGVRVSGLTALNEEDLLFVPDEQGAGEELVLRVREKGNTERLVPADDDVRLLVRAYLGHPELEAVDRVLDSGERVLWVSTMAKHVPVHEYRGEARRLSAQAVHEVVQRAGEAAGIPPKLRHPHALRHLYGTELAESDVSTLGIQALMGHRSPSSSAVYVHLAARKLRQLITGAAPTSKIRTPVSSLARELRRAR